MKPRTPIGLADKRKSMGGGGAFVDRKVATREAFLASAGGTKIDVFVRLRPLTDAERASEPDPSPRVLALEDGRRVQLRERRETEVFSFDRVFDAAATQEDVFGTVMAHQVDAAVRGQSSCVFAYGQTGSGKTHTAFGDLRGAATFGLVPRAAEALFAGLDAKWGRGARELASRAGVEGPGTRPFVRMSILEVYNEELADLLFPNGAPAPAEPHGGAAGARRPGAAAAASATARVLAYAPAIEVIRAELADAARVAAERERERQKEEKKATGKSGIPSGGGLRSPAGGGAPAPPPAAASLSIVEHPTRGTLVLGLSQVEVSSPEQVVELLRVCEHRSHWAETALNKVSNRAHRVITFSVGVEHEGAAGGGGGGGGGGGEGAAEQPQEGEELLADLRIVDLAGSEDTNRSLAAGAAKMEASFINKSLLALGRVIVALASGSPHIPYRESKLTRLLSEALGGVCRTTFVCCASPAAADLSETASTLRYAKRASEALNIASLPKGAQDERVIAALMRRLEALEAEAAEREADAAVAAGAAEAAARRAEAEITSLSDALARTAAHVGRLRSQCIAAAGALSVIGVRADRLEADCESLRGELATACGARDGFAADRAALVETLAGARATRDVLLSAAGDVEAALSGEARALAATVRRAAGDAEALHADIAKRRALSERNAAAVDDFAERAAGAGAALAATALSLREEAGALNEGAAGALAELGAERAAHAAGVAGDVRRLTRTFTDVLAALADAVAQAEAAAKAASLRQREDARAACEGACGALSALRAAAEAGLANVRAGAVALEDAVGGGAARAGAKADAMAAAAEAWGSRVAGEAGALSSGLAASAAATGAAAEAHGAALEALRASEAAEGAAAAERLTAEFHSFISRALSELTASGAARMSKATAALRAEAGAAAGESAAAARRGAAAAAGLAAGGEAAARAAASDAAEMRRIAAATSQAAGGLLASLRAATEGVGSDVGERAARVGARLASATDALAESLLAGDAAVAALAAGVGARGGAAAAAAVAAAESLAGGVAAAAVAHGAKTAELRASMGDRHVALTSGLDSVLAALHRSAESVATFSQAEFARDACAPPPVAAYSTPATFAAMPPLEEAVAAAAAARGGGARGALLAAWAREAEVRDGKKNPGPGTDYPAERGGAPGEREGAAGAGSPPRGRGAPALASPAALAADLLSPRGARGAPFEAQDLAKLSSPDLKAVAAAALAEVASRAREVDAEGAALLEELAGFQSSAAQTPTRGGR
jgi:hypothetical protein